MLKQIYCDKFHESNIKFHSGLNTIIGDDIASNSIGKSTMLMIIDFVFGGSDYITKNHDAIEQLDHHEIRFIFEFEGISYYFIRSTGEYQFVVYCNEKFEKVEIKKLDEYTEWLQRNYKCELEDLSFRNIIGRYFRIYGKENLNERKPIQYFEKETAQKSIEAILKLFDKYSILKSYEKQISVLKDEKKTLEAAAKKDLIPNATTKLLFNKNEKRIKELTEELEGLKKEISTATTEIEALVSKEILQLKNVKSQLIIQKNTIVSRLSRTQLNIKNRSVDFKSELEQLGQYFPNFNIQQIKKIDDFHRILTNNLKNELAAVEKELKNKIADIEKQVTAIDKEIDSILTIQNAPKFAVDKVVDIVAQINQLTAENGYYSKKKGLEDSIDAAKKDLYGLKEKALNDMCNQVNIKMYELNKMIYPDGRRAPTFNTNGNKYTFDTYGDTGTGTAFANLITFDLALLDLTCLPAIAHDLPLLKNIENIALENIIYEYDKRSKQIFIAIDKLSSYDVAASKVIEKKKVLQLSKDKLLFIKNWKKRDESTLID